uniref:Uncharacterized protein n=1 Tax=Siphoviridae sp. cti6K1 TaxID=2825620 RepID=A0A8S5UAC1_9CAUD|nr:MAG TPA: hypothetical protein [Siphoviridae sp. cti6K1]
MAAVSAQRVILTVRCPELSSAHRITVLYLIHHKQERNICLIQRQ